MVEPGYCCAKGESTDKDEEEAEKWYTLAEADEKLAELESK